jgi:hypothetical protein
LIDDFSRLNQGNLPGDPTPRLFNLVGGDYGELGAPFVIRPSERLMEITIGSENVGQPEPESNPGTTPTFNYWFAKFDLPACFDLTGYSAIQFDLLAPAGVNMNFTMTQRSADCQIRLLDSIYHPLTRYSTPDGTKKTITLPLSDYATNLRGGRFDFRYLKDWTIVNLSPVGARVQISNLMLRGCLNTTTSSTVGTSTGTSSTFAAPSASQTKSSAAATYESWLFALGALFL